MTGEILKRLGNQVWQLPTRIYGQVGRTLKSYSFWKLCLSRWGLTSIAAVALAACGNPYALNLAEINYASKQAPGVIQFTDPKLFKREALINERKDELGFLEELLVASKTQQFEPEIVRELETIKAFSASLGLEFDPAVGADFERQSAVADLKNEIELTRLDLELSQLKRDAELLEEQLKTQETPVNNPDGGNTTTPTVTSAVSAPDTSKLLAEIEKIRAKLEARLNTPVKPLTKSGAIAGPIDEFQDRAAYRSTLKSAINAVSLDELHDREGNSLFRLQLKATVLPGAQDLLDTLGVLRMNITEPDFSQDTDALENLYLEWLMHVNNVLNLPPEAGGQKLSEQRFRPHPELVTLGEGGQVYKLSVLEFPKQGLSVDTSSCAGVQNIERTPEKCWYVRVALPALDAGDPDPLDFNALLNQVMSAPKTTKFRLYGALKNAVKRVDNKKLFNLDGSCQNFIDRPGNSAGLNRVDDPATVVNEADRVGVSANDALSWSIAIRNWWPFLNAFAGQLARVDYDDPDLESSISALGQQFLGEMQAAREAAGAFLVAVAEDNPKCQDDLLTSPDVSVPTDFFAVLTKHQSRIAVYDVAPTERTKRISTAARAAEAVSLAAAAAGQLPTYGLGLSGNFAFSRSAVGKADAIERAPLVVGFAEPRVSADGATGAFGWLLGPDVSLNPEEQKLELRHRVAPYDLFADVSLPGWWPYFDVTALTAWAPDWQSAGNGRTAKIAMANALSRKIRVPLRHNAADMDGLTNLLLSELVGQRVAYPRIASVQPSRLSACADTIEFQISGENIWRTSLIHIGGLAVEGSSIKVLPDMRGVLATVEAKKVPVIGADGSTTVTVWTQDGRATYPIRFSDVRSGANCSPRTPQTSPPKGPVITRIFPVTISVCDPEPRFTVVGKNLGPDTNVVLGTLPGVVRELAPGDHTVLEVKVALAAGVKKANAIGKWPLVIHTAKGVAATDVNINHNKCS